MASYDAVLWTTSVLKRRVSLSERNTSWNIHFARPVDCTFQCLKNVLCLSINMAAFKGADGKLLCELLSSDKYRNLANYQENMSSLHLFIQVGTYLSNTKTACSFIQLFFRNSLVLPIIFFLFKSPCSSSPCRNVETCIQSFKYNSYDCLCEQSFAGEYCEKGNWYVYSG